MLLVAGRYNRSGRQPKTYVTPEAAITVFELLMMGSVSPETCWAIKKHWNNKFYYMVASCWFFIWVLHSKLYHKRPLFRLPFEKEQTSKTKIQMKYKRTFSYTDVRTRDIRPSNSLVRVVVGLSRLRPVHVEDKMALEEVLQEPSVSLVSIIPPMLHTPLSHYQRYKIFTVDSVVK